MARMIPRNSNQIKDLKPGEKALFQLIKSKLPDDWICYAKRKIAEGNEPDFLLIGPDLGIIVIEEKSLPINMVNSANSKTWNIVRDGKVIEEHNPEEQARGYVLQAVNLLRKNARLRQEDGRLKFPYGQCVILSNIPKLNLKIVVLLINP